MQKFHYIIFLIVLLTTFSCTDKKTETPKTTNAPKPVLVDVMIAQAKPLRNIIEVNGNALANEMVELHPEISGRIIELKITDGGIVKKGDVLARVYDADLQANLNKTKVLLDLAQKTEKRYKQLLAVNGINQSDYDAALNTVNSYKADLEVTKAQIDKTVIRAPFNGQLGLRQISPGAFVTPQTLLSTLQQMDKIKIDFSIPELYRPLAIKGNTVSIQGGDDTVKRKATIIATEPEINSNTGNLKVRAITNASSIHPGNFIKVALNGAVSSKAISVPTSAIIPEATSRQLVLIKEGKAKFVKVETGVRVPGHVEILKGVNLGDTIVVTGVLFVRPGSIVKIKSVIQQ